MNSYDLIARFYEHIIDDVLYAIYLDLIEKYTHPSTALEIGCGTATLSRDLARKGYSVTAMDISESMLEIASYYAGTEKLDIQFLHQDAVEKIPQGFDLIVLPTDVINHLKNEEDVYQLANNIYQSLNTQGYLIFDTLHCDYLETLNGYQETIYFEGHEIIWSAKKIAPCTIEHQIYVEDDLATHIEKSYKEAFYKDVFKHFNVIALIPLEERTIWVIKKEN